MDHAQIITLAMRIAEANERSIALHATAKDLDSESAAKDACSVDDDICQLCVEMRLLCRNGESELRAAALAYLGVNRSQGVTDSAYENAEARLEAALSGGKPMTRDQADLGRAPSQIV